MRFRLHWSETVQQASFLQDCSEPLLATKRYRLGISQTHEGRTLAACIPRSSLAQALSWPCEVGSVISILQTRDRGAKR